MIRPLYLSQARLDRSRPVSALVSVLDPFDADRAVDVHHRLVWTLFADDDERERDFLWRNDDGQFLILSERQPEDGHGLFELRTKLFEPHLAPGDRLGFRLRANAVVTRTERVGDGEKRRRFDVVMDRLLHQEAEGASRRDRGARRPGAAREAATTWLERQGEQHGFALEALESSSYRTVRLHRSKGADGSLGVLDLDGVLTVRKPTRMLAAVANGFGKAKAFGYGLMLLRRA